MEIYSLVIFGMAVATRTLEVSAQSEDACDIAAKSITKRNFYYPYAMCINQMTGEVFMYAQGRQVDVIN